jgi:hypothetical protein
VRALQHHERHARRRLGASTAARSVQPASREHARRPRSRPRARASAFAELLRDLCSAARVRGWLLQQGRARRRRQLLRWRTGPRSVAVANSSAAAGTGTRHQLQSQREPARDVPERQAVPEVWQSVLPLPSQVRVCAMSESIDSIGSYHHPYIRSVHSCCTAHPHLSL